MSSSSETSVGQAFVPVTAPVIPPAPKGARRRLEQLTGQRKALVRLHTEKSATLASTREYLALAPQIDAALDALSEELFGRLARTIEQHLTNALQDVLAQPIALKIERDYKRGSATMRFYIERDGQPEDIMRGQGGSVANVLSVGLRILALMTLDPKQHRRCLVLDEQDCWLAPDLVPRLVKIVHDACRRYGFQVLMISHHSPSAFAQYADRIYGFAPTADGVSVAEVAVPAACPD